ncbi:hypothetical protein [Streptomyces sp. NPDC059916]|uniref:hypothetical protein n=1 Tax=Streptomyces sp. NPDC059916 TaxID=3347001 RepID=UPI0036BF9496
MRLHLDEPLSPQMEEQVRKGHLVPVEADAGEPVEDGTPQEPADDGEPKRPNANSKVDDWRTFAVGLGMPEDEAAGATKAELVGWVEVAEGSGE